MVDPPEDIDLVEQDLGVADQLPGNFGKLGGVPGQVGCREVVVAGVLGSWLSWGVVSAGLEAAGEDGDGGHPYH